MYLNSKLGYCDLIAMVPDFLFLKRERRGLLRIAKLYKVVRIHVDARMLKTESHMKGSADLYGQKLLLVTYLILYVYLLASVIYILHWEEIHHNGTPMFSDGFPEEFRWHDALYMTIVTISTVGYGDVLPVTWQSRMVILVAIVTGIFIFPAQASN